MMRSMFSGVSGLRAHQTRMDVIGNNIANVNTVAFKSGRVTFQEIFSETLRGASAPNLETGRGGTNPMQIGLGLGVNAIDTIMTRGSTQRTDNPTDLAIEGEGFFIVRGGRGDSFKFTRAGNFILDKLGNLTTGGGLNVLGWEPELNPVTGEYEFNSESELVELNLLNKQLIEPKATTKAVMKGNLDAGYAAGDTFSAPITVYDKQGNAYEVKAIFTREATTATGSPWNVTFTYGGTAATGSLQLVFGKDGRLISTTNNVNVTIDLPDDAGVDDPTFNVDFSSLTMYASDCSVKTKSVDGYKAGTLSTFSIGADGVITGIYSNGEQQPLGMIALATFDNPAGLQKLGENLFLPTTNSGDFAKGVKPGVDGAGMLSPGTLEMSNVDLSREFTEMIVTQRGFQANSRIISTSDEMLQELVNIKR